MIKKRLIIFTDAWKPQINGVVFTLKHTEKELERRGISVEIISPQNFNIKFRCPFYKQIKLSVPNSEYIRRRLSALKPDYVHIATEGPIGYYAARLMQKRKIPYTSSYHTKFPDYVKMRLPFIKRHMVYSYLKKIHAKADRILVTTPSMVNELEENEFNRDRMVTWGRGVDTSFFTWKKYKNMGKNLLYVGRISREKNIDSLLSTISMTPFTIRLVGDGPDLKSLKKKYSKYENIIFTGVKTGDSLLKEYHSSDIFVFPSKSDTFGIVQLEAMACGLPVAAYNVCGPRDIITPGVNGYMGENLHATIHKCTKIDSKTCAESVQFLTWEAVTDIFEDSLVDIGNRTW